MQTNDPGFHESFRPFRGLVVVEFLDQRVSMGETSIEQAKTSDVKPCLAKVMSVGDGVDDLVPGDLVSYKHDERVVCAEWIEADPGGVAFREFGIVPRSTLTIGFRAVAVAGLPDPD